MTEAIQQEKSAPPDTTVVVTGATMQEYTEARASGGEFKPAGDPKPEPQANAEEQEQAGETDPPEQSTEAEPKIGEDGKPVKELTAKQIKANERWKAREEAIKTAENRATAAERRAQELQAKYEPPAKIPEAEPDPTKYTDAKQYAEDYANYRDAQRQAKEAQERAQTERVATQNRFNQRRDELKKTVTDWDERSQANAGIQMATEVIDAIMDSEVNAEIVYELTPAEIGKINAMPKMRDKIRAIGRLEAKILAGKGETKQAEPERIEAGAEVSKAPEPVRPINATKTGPVSRVDKDGNYLGTQDEFERDYAAGKLTKH